MTERGKGGVTERLRGGEGETGRERGVRETKRGI